MKKKGGLALSLIIIAIVLIVGIGIGVFYFSGSQDNNQSNSEEIEQGIKICDDVRDIPERQNCYFELAMNEGHMVCDKIDNTNSCYESLAVEKEDHTICNLQQTTRQNKDSCIWAYMWQTSDYSVCKEIDTVSVKDSCYVVVATRTKDISWCDKIETTSEKEQCLSMLNLVNAEN